MKADIQRNQRSWTWRSKQSASVHTARRLGGMMPVWSAFPGISMERRLAAILAVDVVGFSRLMEVDEAGTLAALKIRRKEVLGP
ncbi:MAG: adenylate/guanylate cyclase domain-containing protein, partial [Mesorhizobium sp.]